MSPQRPSPALRDARARLLAAALEQVAERGYADTSVDLILASAGVPRWTFDEHFADKEECVLASYDLTVDLFGERIAAAAAATPEWPEAVKAVVAAAVEMCAADPRVATFCGVEIPGLGCAGFARHEACVERLAIQLRLGRGLCPRGAQLPDFLETALLGGAIRFLGYCARLDQPERLAGLAPEITYLLLVPYLDVEEATRIAGPATVTRSWAPSS